MYYYRKHQILLSDRKFCHNSCNILYCGQYICFNYTEITKSQSREVDSFLFELIYLIIKVGKQWKAEENSVPSATDIMSEELCQQAETVIFYSSFTITESKTHASV